MPQFTSNYCIYYDYNSLRLISFALMTLMAAKAIAFLASAIQIEKQRYIGVVHDIIKKQIIVSNLLYRIKHYLYHLKSLI